MLSSSVASGGLFLKVLGVEEEPHLMTVLIKKMSAIKELQTLSEDMSDWLSRSKQGIAALVCVLYRVYTGEHGTARHGSCMCLHCTIFYRAKSIVKGGDFIMWGE